jgi:hypothetical protein
MPDPDLLIRTSGELRVSNFLLWQMAYTEIYVTDTYWPDFRNKELLLAILDYQSASADSEKLVNKLPILQESEYVQIQNDNFFADCPCFNNICWGPGGNWNPHSGISSSG